MPRVKIFFSLTFPRLYPVLFAFAKLEAFYYYLILGDSGDYFGRKFCMSLYLRYSHIVMDLWHALSWCLTGNQQSGKVMKRFLIVRKPSLKHLIRVPECFKNRYPEMFFGFFTLADFFASALQFFCASILKVVGSILCQMYGMVQ